jgi:outer membrane protein assembly factor BamE (lipoprotein component of BamABCDE complex)
MLAVALVAVAIQLLVGCPVPLPPMGYEESSRGNVPAARPAWIVEGTTSRADVLLRLGSPDGEAVDGSWMGYLSSKHEGGVAFVLIVGTGGGAVSVEGYTERRLVLWFDERGIVLKALFEEAQCPRAGLFVGGSIKSGPCMGFADVGGESSSSPARPPPGAADVIATFADTIWAVPYFDLLTGTRPRDYAAYRGPVIVMADRLRASGKAIGGDARSELEIEFRYVTDIGRHALGRAVTLVVVADRVEHGFTVVQPGALGLIDAEKTDQLIKIIEARLNRTARPR